MNGRQAIAPDGERRCVYIRVKGAKGDKRTAIATLMLGRQTYHLGQTGEWRDPAVTALLLAGWRGFAQALGVPCVVREFGGGEPVAR